MDSICKRLATIDIAGNLGTTPTAVEWYQGLIGRIAQQLRLDLDIKTWWDQTGGITANEKLTEFFDIKLFQPSDASVVIFLDEIDSTPKLKYTDDFFTTIRAMYKSVRDVGQQQGIFSSSGSPRRTSWSSSTEPRPTTSVKPLPYAISAATGTTFRLWSTPCR